MTGKSIPYHELHGEMQRRVSVYEQVLALGVSAKAPHFDSKLPLDHSFLSNHCFDLGPKPHHLIQGASQVHHSVTTTFEKKKQELTKKSATR